MLFRKAKAPVPQAHDPQTNLRPTGVASVYHWPTLGTEIRLFDLSDSQPKDKTMNKFLSFLSALETAEETLLTAKVPFLSTGIGGKVLTIALIAETEVTTFLQAFQAAKNSAAPVAPAAPPAPAV